MPPGHIDGRCLPHRFKAFKDGLANRLANRLAGGMNGRPNGKLLSEQQDFHIAPRRL